MSAHHMVIVAGARGESFWHLMNPMRLVALLWQRRELLWQFVWWEVQDKYRGSYLGILWMSLTPLFRLAVYTFIFATVFQARKEIWDLDTTLDMAMMIFAGLVIFHVFSECGGRAATLMWKNQNYVHKIVFPLEILPVGVLGSVLVHTAVRFGLLLLFFPFSSFHLTWYALLLPLIIVPMALISLGVSYFLASLGVFVRDVGNLMQNMLQLLFFLTAVIYPLTKIPEAYRWLFKLNPLSVFVENFRNVLIRGIAPDWNWLLWSIVLSFLVLIFGYGWFMRTKREFADVI